MRLKLGTMIWDAVIHLWTFSSQITFKAIGLDVFIEVVYIDKEKKGTWIKP